jgi:hypothetical protein
VSSSLTSLTPPSQAQYPASPATHGPHVRALNFSTPAGTGALGAQVMRMPAPPDEMCGTFPLLPTPYMQFPSNPLFNPDPEAETPALAGASPIGSTIASHPVAIPADSVSQQSAAATVSAACASDAQSALHTEANVTSTVLPTSLPCGSGNTDVRSSTGESGLSRIPRRGSRKSARAEPGGSEGESSASASGDATEQQAGGIGGAVESLPESARLLAVHLVSCVAVLAWLFRWM